MVHIEILPYSARTLFSYILLEFWELCLFTRIDMYLLDSDEEICQEDGEHQDTIDDTIDEATPLNIDRRRSDGDRPVKSSPDKRRQLRRQSLVETSFRGSCNLAPENDLGIFNNN